MPFKEPVNLPGEIPEKTAAHLAKDMELTPVAGESMPAGVESPGAVEQAVQKRADQQAAAVIAAQIQRGDREGVLGDASLAKREALLAQHRQERSSATRRLATGEQTAGGGKPSLFARALAWMSPGRETPSPATQPVHEPPTAEAEIQALDRADFQTLDAQLREAGVYTPEAAQAFLRFVSSRLEAQLQAVYTVDPDLLFQQIKYLKQLFAESARSQSAPAFDLALDYLGRAGVYVNSRFSNSFNDDGRTWKDGRVVDTPQG